MRQISRRMEMIHATIGWRWDEHGTHKHGSWILWSVPHVRLKTMHSMFFITSWLPYITLCYIDLGFFLPLEQSCMALLGCCLVSSWLCLLAIKVLHRKDVSFLIYLTIHVPWDSWLNNELHFSCHKNVWPQQPGKENGRVFYCPSKVYLI